MKTIKTELVKSVAFGLFVINRFYSDGSVSTQTYDRRNQLITKEIVLPRKNYDSTDKIIKFHEKYGFELAYREKISA